jgi:hypothetical protein
MVTGAFVLPMLIGSVINIWYNVTNIDPLLTPDQRAIFMRTVTLYNGLVYPVLGGLWVCLLLTLRAPFREQTRGSIGDPGRRLAAQRMVINLPWWGVGTRD